MTVLYPCVRCSLKANCDIRTAKLAEIKGHGLTSARFRCAKKAAEFRPGRRVDAYLASAIQEDVGSYDPAIRYSDAIARGTIIGRASRPDRLLVWIDGELIEQLGLTLRSELGLCALYASKLTLLDEPDRPERVAELKERDRAIQDHAFGDHR
jgi:hypothetical protein